MADIRRQKGVIQSNSSSNKLSNFMINILLGILANMKNFLYVYSTSLSAYLFYEAMQRSFLYTLPVLGFLAISYIPIFYRRRSE
jgi:hypothetical protein